MRILFALFLFLIGWNIISAQSADNRARIDSLERLLEIVTESGQEKVDILNQLGYEYWIIEPNQSERYGLEALEIAQASAYPAGNAFANRVIGVAHWARGNLELAFRYLLDAEADYRELNDQSGLANSRLNLGLAYTDQRNFDMAHQKIHQALQSFRQLGDQSRIATSYTKLGDLLTIQQAYDSAFTYLREALDIHQQTNFLYGIAEVNNKLGKLAIAKEDYNEAISYFLVAMTAGGQRNDHVGLAENNYGIGYAYLQQTNYTQARTYLTSALRIAETFGLKKILRDAYYSYMELEKAEGNYRAAVGYYDNYLTVRDTLFNEEQANIIANLEAQRTFADKERELQLAQRDLDLLVQRKKTDRLTILALVMGLISLAAIGFGMIQRKNSKLARKQQDLLSAQRVTSELQYSLKAKDQELTSYTLNFVQKNELIADLKARLKNLKPQLERTHQKDLDAIGRQLDTALRVDEDWSDFRRHFESVHPELIGRLTKDYPKLTKNEFKLIALLRLKLSSKEISTVLGISPDSVKTARYRLRKKLDIDPKQELFDFLLQYEQEL
ncbi:MAG: tetratricopeptide repeat protein [Bacteroidota bacterium]